MAISPSAETRSAPQNPSPRRGCAPSAGPDLLATHVGFKTPALPSSGHPVSASSLITHGHH